MINATDIRVFIFSYRKALIVIGILALIWLIWIISGAIMTSRYEKRLAAATAAANAANQAAAVKVSEANAYRDQGENLKIQLEAREREISSLESQLSEARKRSATTRTVYVQTQTTPQSPIVLSGDPIPDRRRICAALSSIGIACKD